MKTRWLVCLALLAGCDSNEEGGASGGSPGDGSSEKRRQDSSPFASWSGLQGARVGDWARYDVERKRIGKGPSEGSTVTSDPHSYRYSVAVKSKDSVTLDVEVANPKWGTSFRARFEIRSSMTRLEAMSAEVAALRDMFSVPRYWEAEFEPGSGIREESGVLVAEGSLRQGEEKSPATLRVEEKMESDIPIFGRRTLEARLESGAEDSVVRFELAGCGMGG